MTPIILLVAIVLIIMAGAWWSGLFQHPEDSASHDDGSREADTTSERFYRGADRPAGPDAEDPPAPDDPPPGGPPR